MLLVAELLGRQQDALPEPVVQQQAVARPPEQPHIQIAALRDDNREVDFDALLGKLLLVGLVLLPRRLPWKDC